MSETGGSGPTEVESRAPTRASLETRQTVTVAEAFRAMRLFLYRFHERGDLGAEALPSILRWTSVRRWKQDDNFRLLGTPPSGSIGWDAVVEALKGIDPDDLVVRPPAPA